MILALCAIVAGLVILVRSADLFVDGSVGVARYFGMSTFLVGMVVVGFGTSAPELFVSVLSAIQGNPELSLGNAYGSNIANIALILGVTAAISPVLVKRIAIKRDIPILCVITFASLWLVADGSVGRVDGVVLLLLFVSVMTVNIMAEYRRKSKVSMGDEAVGNEGVVNPSADSETKKISLSKSLLRVIIGIVLLVVSSRMLVWGAVFVAKALGVSDLLIGLTIVAVGTSLPELASSIAAARKGEDDLAVGNVVGSNTFNTLAVVGIASVISPMESVDAAVISRDLPLVAAVSILLLMLGLPKKKFSGNGRIGRKSGIFFLLLYVAYLAMLIAEAIG